MAAPGCSLSRSLSANRLVSWGNDHAPASGIPFAHLNQPISHTTKEVLEMNFVPWKSRQRESESMPSSFANLRTEIDRLLESYVREPLSTLGGPFGGQRGCAPPVDLAENPDEVVVRAEVPGVDPSEIEVTFSGGQLVLAGEKHDIIAGSGREFYHTESRFGRFRRTIPLPQAIDAENVEAEYLHGVLTIRLKKTSSIPPKRVTVRVREGESTVSCPTSPASPEAVPPIS